MLALSLTSDIALTEPNARKKSIIFVFPTLNSWDLVTFVVVVANVSCY